MRLLGMILALGAIAWLLLSASDGGKNGSVIPEPYQQSMDKAKDVEQALKDSQGLVEQQLNQNDN